MARFTTENFFFTKETNTFSAYISDLSMGRTKQVFERIYNDSADQGVTLLSTKTGKVVTFVLDETDYINAGTDDIEIAGWRLVPTQESVRRVPNCRNLKMLIIND